MGDAHDFNPSTWVWGKENHHESEATLNYTAKACTQKDFKWGQERRVGSKEAILLFLKTWVGFPAPGWWLKPSRIPVLGKLMASSDPWQSSGMHLGHRHTGKQNIHTYEIKINIFKWINKNKTVILWGYLLLNGKDSIPPTSSPSSPMSVDWDEDLVYFFLGPKTQTLYIKS